MNKTNIKELNKLVKENPDIDIEILIVLENFNEDYDYQRGEFTKPQIALWYKPENELFSGKEEIFNELGVRFGDLNGKEFDEKFHALIEDGDIFEVITIGVVKII